MMELDNRYWDCECENHYIHPKTVETCAICGAEQDEQPDSIAQEVRKGDCHAVYSLTITSPIGETEER